MDINNVEPQNEIVESAVTKPRKPLPLKGILLIIAFIVILVGIGGIRLYIQQTKDQTAETTTISPTISVIPDKNQTDKDQVLLIPVELDVDLSEDTLIADSSSSAVLTLSPSDVDVSTTPSSVQKQRITLVYLFSVYKNTAIISNQTNVNQLVIGGQDKDGKKYGLFSYFTPADETPAAIFTGKGDRVAFQEHDGVYVYSFKTNEKRKITDFNVASYSKWNYNDTKLAVQRKEGDTRTWYIYDYNTDALTKVPVSMGDVTTDFGWMSKSNGYAVSSSKGLDSQVYISMSGEVPKLIEDFTCNSALMFSEFDRYLICSSMWLSLYDINTQKVTQQNGQADDGEFFYNPVWVYNGKNIDDPILIVQKATDTFVTTVSNFYFNSKPVVKLITLSPENIKPNLYPNVSNWRIRSVNTDKALAMGTMDGNTDSIILISGFQTLGMSNPRLSFNYVSDDKGFFNHGFSIGEVSFEM